MFLFTFFNDFKELGNLSNWNQPLLYEVTALFEIYIMSEWVFKRKPRWKQKKEKNAHLQGGGILLFIYLFF